MILTASAVQASAATTSATIGIPSATSWKSNSAPYWTPSAVANESPSAPDSTSPRGLGKCREAVRVRMATVSPIASDWTTMSIRASSQIQ